MKKTIRYTVLFVLLLAGCKDGEGPALKDETTVPDIPVVDMKDGYFIYPHRHDNMDRGDHDFEGRAVIDPNYYERHPFKRGEIVYFQNPDFDHKKYPRITLEKMSISRIVALPGETIEIKKGQIYVDRRKLDSFYGKAHRIGSDIEGLKKGLEQNPDGRTRQNLEHAIKDLESNQLDALRVPDGHVFVIGDDWFRSFDSRHFGPLPIDSIQGKVLGYPAPPPAK
ncbi:MULTISPECIES: signal peptidase I [Paenibacillus]|uniref:Signal peptidase I n=1 Tax=Paenibacillus albilobatus TaxID=2716884 RepID=A0A919XBT7_9BACL|nr:MULTISPECIES: signal peptidase I [Paenibacillus]GIO29781.1 hypothetical protein J2TS6_09220 [Paenibacillus albilobatus]